MLLRWLSFRDSINAIDFTLNAKIAQFSFNCGSDCQGCLSEAGCSVFLLINHLLLMIMGWVGPFFVGGGECTEQVTEGGISSRLRYLD